MISRESVDRIQDTARIEEVVGDYVQLRRRGVNMIGLCPFHNEKTPSFTVSPSKNIYKCFGCGKAGNPVNFVMEHESLSFPEALRYLAKRYGIEIEETGVDPVDDEAEKQRQSLFLVNEFASAFYQRQLTDTDEGRSIGLSYFRDRGYREDTIRKFQLGYAPADRKALTDAALQAGYNLDLLKKLGLNGRFDQDFFQERVIFPIQAPNGKVLAFAGRYLQKQSNSPKYINSPETEIYNKSKVLYGMNFARQAIRKEDKVFLVEGYTDVITLHQSGVENVVASSGTSLTLEQIRLIKRYTAQVSLLYDGDPAGIKAALRGVDLLLEEDLNVRVVLLPAPEDPDSYLKKFGAQAFLDYVKAEEKDFILFKTGLLAEEAGNDPIRKSQLVKDLVTSIARIPDAIKRALYIRECAGIFKMPESLLLDETNAQLKSRLGQRRQDQIKEALQVEEIRQADELRDQELPQSGYSDEFQERDVVRVLISMGHLPYEKESGLSVAQYMLSALQDHLDQFDNPLYRRLIEHYGRLFHEGKAGVDSLVQDPDREISQTAINLLTSPYEYSENWEKRWDIYLQNQLSPAENQHEEARQVILRLRMRKISRLIKENQDILSGDKSLSAQDLDRHLKAHHLLLQMRNAIAAELSTVVL